MRLPSFLLYCKLIEPHSTFRDNLEYEDRVRRDRRIPRLALKQFKYSTFKYLYISENSQILMDVTGHDRHSFRLLLSKFKHGYDFNMMDESGYIFLKNIVDQGMPMGLTRQLKTIGGSGIIIMWYHTQGSCTRNLALIFGQTCTTMYTWLKFGRRVILHALSRDIDSKVSITSVEDIRFYQEAIGAKYLYCINS